MRSNKNKISFFFRRFSEFFGAAVGEKEKKKVEKLGRNSSRERHERTNEHKPANAERKKEKGEVVVVVGMTIETFKLFLNISSRGRDWPRVFLSTGKVLGSPRDKGKESTWHSSRKSRMSFEKRRWKGNDEATDDPVTIRGCRESRHPPQPASTQETLSVMSLAFSFSRRPCLGAYLYAHVDDELGRNKKK